MEARSLFDKGLKLVLHQKANLILDLWDVDGVLYSGAAGDLVVGEAVTLAIAVGANTL